MFALLNHIIESTAYEALEQWLRSSKRTGGRHRSKMGWTVVAGGNRQGVGRLETVTEMEDNRWSTVKYRPPKGSKLMLSMLLKRYVHKVNK